MASFEDEYDPNIALNDKNFVEYLDTLSAEEFEETDRGRNRAAMTKLWRRFREQQR